ncbi:hypothetical protein [Acidobacterium sp. S8]|uniref:hypothetical protein n=1 Tax=Acidobacterium sp. S8 TaxID=1641854 RepID=UPI001C20B4C7|nr:hypothetical protein [Acidobacterium sp. S8]
MSQPTGGIKTVQAASTAQFIDSIGVGSHFGAGYSSTPYRKQTAQLIQLLINSGIRHIRDGGTYHDGDYRTMASAGIHVTFVTDPKVAIIPTPDYWCNKNGYKTCILLADYLKGLGPGIVDSVEGLNEINASYPGIKWHAALNDPVTNAPDSPNYWVKYAISYTGDTCNVLRHDPTLSSVKCLAPSLSGATSVLFPQSEFYGTVDYGALHPYPYGGNNHGTPVVAYDGVPDYFRWTTDPDINIDEYPWWIERMAAYVRSPDGLHDPIIATETGYYTGSATLSIPEDVQGKYVPRLFAEYFRHGFDRSFWYELVDEAAHPLSTEANYGLLRNDLTPKPGYLALQSLIALLRDSSTSAPSSAGSLAYGLSVDENGAFTHTQYVHDLLLQKGNGVFYLLLWHEISDVATRTNQGQLRSTDQELYPPALNTTIKLPPNILTATLYKYDSQWQLRPTALSIQSHALKVAAADTISVIELRS